jgi:hypothetical protein
VPEEVWFQKHVTTTLYLAKRARPELLTAVSFLATRVTKCDSDDVDKLIRLIRYIRSTREMGMILRPGASWIRVQLFVDASYGVHADGRSHTGSCVVIDGALSLINADHSLVKKNREGEIIGGESRGTDTGADMGGDLHR